MQPVLDSWPGPVTWILPAAANTSKWLTGEHNGIAVRVTAHPLSRELCRTYRGAIVSTSANRQGRDPAKSARQVSKEFTGTEIDYILQGELGGRDKPSRIIDGLSGEVLR